MSELPGLESYIIYIIKKQKSVSFNIRIFYKRRSFEMGLTTQQNLGKNLKILRASKGVSQAEMSEYIGLTRSSYAQYELGNRMPDAYTLYVISRFYCISMDLLFVPNLSKFLSEMTYFQIDGDNSQLLIENFRRLSPFNKGRLVEYSQKLIEWDKFKEENLKQLEKHRQAD